MKLDDILNEGMEFHASTIEDHPKHGKLVSPHGMKKEMQECWVCDGMAGKIKGYECRACNNTGQKEEWVSEGPEMQVSNANGHAIQRDIIGVEPDNHGIVKNKDLPALRRRLIKMLNVDKEREQMHQAPSDEQGPMHRRGSEGNVTSIGRQGPRMIDMGRTDEQVLHYAKKLLDMVEYAQKHNLVISWA